MTAPLDTTPRFESLVSELVARAVEARAAELQRPEYVTQRTVAAVCGMPPRDFLRHCRQGDWPTTADRRLRLAKTSDVLAWIAAHPVKRPENDGSDEAAVFAKSRSGLRRIAP